MPTVTAIYTAPNGTPRALALTLRCGKGRAISVTGALVAKNAP
jgi:hypothetical protein